MAKKKLRKLKYGEGSFRHTSNGRVEYRFGYKDEFGQTQRKSFTGDDEMECLYKAQEFLEKEEKRQQGIDMDSTIVDIVMKRYDEDLAMNFIGEQGYCRNVGTLQIIKKSTIGKMAIIDIEERHIINFLKTITHYSNSTIEKLFNQMKMAFQEAYDGGVVEGNMMMGKAIRRPKSDRPDKKVRGMTEDEQAIFVEAIQSDRIRRNYNDYRKQLLIELYSGMRMGEINALRPEDIDFKNKVINVKNTISRGLNYESFVKDGTKTYAGRRQVPMNKMLEPILRDAISEMKKNPYGLIFYDYHKKDLITTNQVNSYFNRVSKRCGLEHRGQHCLRHTFATRCIEAEIQPVVLKNWLGHKDIHITLDTYADVFDRMNFGAVEKLEDHIKKLENII